MTTRRSLVELAILLGLFAGAVAILPVDAAVEGGAGGKLFVLGRMAALVLIATWLLRRSGHTWADLGLRRPRPWWSLPMGAAAGLLASALATAAVAALVLPALGLDRAERSAFLRLHGDLPEFLFWALPVAWGSAAFGEEMIFRGFVLHRLQAVFGGRVGWAIAGQAAVFGALHLYQGLGGALVTGATALVLGLAWLWTGRNLWAPILIHGTLDTVSMAAFYRGAPLD